MTPVVKGKTFPYTPEGEKAAKEYANGLREKKRHATRPSRYADTARATVERMRA